jgi:hypothetical protein
VTVINNAGASRQRTSTEEIKDAVNDILGISPRQRELERRQYDDEPMSDDERAELADYRAARAEKRRQDSEAELQRLRRDRLLLAKPGGQPH